MMLPRGLSTIADSLVLTGMKRKNSVDPIPERLHARIQGLAVHASCCRKRWRKGMDEVI